MKKKPITIAYVIDQLAIGGTENQLLDLIRYLDKSKFRIYLICLRNSDYFNNIDMPCEKKVLDVYSLASVSSLKKLFAFSKWLKNKKIDIVQSFFFDATIFSTLAARICGGIKVISSKRDMGFWYTPKLLFVLRKIKCFIDVYIVNSTAIRQIIINKEKINPMKIHVIYNGINPPEIISQDKKQYLRKKYGIGENELTIGIVANLNRSVKRVDLFICAAKMLLEKKKELKFLIVGGGHLMPDLVRLSKDLGIYENMIFTGLVPNPHPIISLFDIGVLTSDSEGFSNSIIEYMVHGLPVVVSRSGGNEEIVDESVNGYLFDQGNTYDLANKVFQIISNMDSHANNKNCNKAKAMSFFWPKIIKIHERLYEYILN